jgi:hypothetical protein
LSETLLHRGAPGVQVGMKRALIALALAACSSNDPKTTSDGGTGSGGSGGGQRVVACSGRVLSGAPSNCPYDDCDETSGNKCTAYASFVPGSSTGVCKAGATGSYGLLFKDPQDATSQFSEVVVCNAGAATLHACVNGFHTDPDGPGGQPGYICS